MRKGFIGVALLFALFFAGETLAATVNTTWKVTGIVDEDGYPVQQLSLDLDFGKYFFQVYGVAQMPGGDPAINGSGYMDPLGVIVMYIKIGQHLLVLVVDGSTFSGYSYLYSPAGAQVGNAGTVELTAVD